jgi:hypothetical protein
MSSDPLMSCLGVVLWSLLLPNAGSWLTDSVYVYQKSHCDWRSVSKSWYRAPSGAHYQIFISVWQLCSCFVGRPLSREDGSVFCMSRKPLPAHPSSGTSPLGLATVFYCLRFETSLFVASYDSQGHGGGIRRRHHTGVCLSICVCRSLNPVFAYGIEDTLSQGSRFPC